MLELETSHQSKQCHSPAKQLGLECVPSYPPPQFDCLWLQHRKAFDHRSQRFFCLDALLRRPTMAINSPEHLAAIFQLFKSIPLACTLSYPFGSIATAVKRTFTPVATEHLKWSVLKERFAAFLA